MNEQYSEEETKAPQKKLKIEPPLEEKPKPTKTKPKSQPAKKNKAESP